MPDAVLDQTLEDVLLEASVVRAGQLVLAQTLDDTTLFSAVFGTLREAEVDQTLESVAVVAEAFLTNTAQVLQFTAEARLTAFVVAQQGGGEGGGPGFIVPRIYNITGQVRDNSGALLCFIGPPWKAVDWRVVEGFGTLFPFSLSTDALGRCTARFDAGGITGTVIIGVAYVP